MKNTLSKGFSEIDIGDRKHARWRPCGILLVIWAVILTACDSGTKWKSGKYEVYWIDVSSDLTLGLDIGDGMAIGRVMPQVYAVGENDTWIVAARHPNGNKSTSEFFYFSKAEDHAHKNAEEIVHGPFTEVEFAKIKADLKLPDWSKRF